MATLGRKPRGGFTRWCNPSPPSPAGYARPHWWFADPAGLWQPKPKKDDGIEKRHCGSTLLLSRGDSRSDPYCSGGKGFAHLERWRSRASTGQSPRRNSHRGDPAAAALARVVAALVEHCEGEGNSRGEQPRLQRRGNPPRENRSIPGRKHPESNSSKRTRNGTGHFHVPEWHHFDFGKEETRESHMACHLIWLRCFILHYGILHILFTKSV
jgi:hypothetical protein